MKNVNINVIIIICGKWQKLKVEFHRINDLVAIDFNKEEDEYIYAKNVEQYWPVNNGQKLEQYNPVKDIDYYKRSSDGVIFRYIYY